MNDSLQVFESKARVTPASGTITSLDLDNPYYLGVDLVLDATASGTGGGLTLYVDGKDNTSGKYYNLIQSTTLIGNGTIVVKIWPGLTAVTNQVANDHLPRTWRVRIIHGNSDPMTYSVGGSYLA